MDSKMLAKLMEKKGKKGDLDENYKKVKMDVLKALHKEMGSMMGDEVKDMKKVTIASPDASGLKMGLEKAKDMLSGMGEEKPEMEEEAEEKEGEVCPECGEVHGDEGHEAEESEEMSMEDIEAKIKELEALKAKKQGM